MKRGVERISDHKALAAEWDPNRNTERAEDVPLGSNKVFWWRCALGHEFQGKPNNRRTRRKDSEEVAVRQCPVCYHRWTWDAIVARVAEEKAKKGYVPSANWFQANGLAAMVGAIYGKHNKTWLDIRHAVDSFEASSFAPSRSGLRWRSKAEACLSDFLYAREIEHEKGRRYPPSYAKASGKRYGVYDLHFLAPLTETWIDVEVWGGHPAKGSDDYARVRAAKIEYNRGNPHFLHVEHTDCYDEKRLEFKLKPYIGVIAPSRFDNDLDHVVPTSHWSTYAEVLAICEQIASERPNGVFPSEPWLRKRGSYADRIGPAYPSLPDAIAMHFGGIAGLRRAMGQGRHNQTQWSKAYLLAEVDKWMKRYGKTPGTIVGDFHRGRSRLPESEVRRAGLIAAMATKYAGGITNALLELGYATKPVTIKSTPFALLQKATAELRKLGRELSDTAQGRRLSLLTTKIYLYAAQIESKTQEDKQ